MPSRLARSVARFIGWIAATRGRAAASLLAVLVLAAGAGVFARGLRVDTNLEALLYPTDPAIAALEELRARQGSTDYLYVAVRSKDPQAKGRFLADVAERMRTWPDLVELSTGRDLTPLRDHALYFLSIGDLEHLRDELERLRRREVAREMAAGVGDGDVALDAVVVEDDWDADPSEWGEDEGDASDTASPPTMRTGEDDDTKDDDIGALLARYRERLAGIEVLPPGDLDLIWPAEDAEGRLPWPERVERPFISADGEVQVIRARLERPATDVAYAREVSARVQRIFDDLDPATYAPDMLAKIGGPYMAAREANAILKDLRNATTVSGGLVAAVLLVSFRRIRALALVLLPIAVSTVFTLAAARILLGELNVLTAFLFAVLLGIGVDFAVHLYAVRERHGRTARWPDVVRHHLRPLTAAMATTVGSFLVLEIARFKGFREFGAIAAVGVAVSYVLALVLVPAIDTVFGPYRGSEAGSSRRLAVAAERALRRLRWPIVAACLIVAVWGTPRVGFERDLRNLRAPESKSEKGVPYSRALGKKTSGTPVIVLADDARQLDRAVDALRRDRSTILFGNEPWIRDVVSLSLYMPKDQERKQAILREIGERADKLLGLLPTTGERARFRSHLEALRRLASAPPLRREDLPDWARLPFLERDGHDDRIALLYTRERPYDLDQVQAVRRRFDLVTQDTGVRGASSRFVLADLSVEVERDARRLPPYAIAAILLLIWIDLRRPTATTICFGSLALGLGVTFGVMGLAPLPVNFYNLVVMPAVVGLGIDASIHLWHARRRGRATTAATSKAALVAALTTAGGFAGLAVADHRGLASIGHLGILATFACVFVAVALLGAPGGSPSGADGA